MTRFSVYIINPGFTGSETFIETLCGQVYSIGKFADNTFGDANSHTLFLGMIKDEATFPVVSIVARHKYRERELEELLPLFMTERTRMGDRLGYIVFLWLDSLEFSEKPELQYTQQAKEMFQTFRKLAPDAHYVIMLGYRETTLLKENIDILRKHLRKNWEIEEHISILLCNVQNEEDTRCIIAALIGSIDAIPDLEEVMKTLRIEYTDQ